MRSLSIILALIMLTGCETMAQQKIVSPSDWRYYDGNRCFEAREYQKAIVKYEEFLKMKPNSDLAVPAQLNLGMSYYYTAEYAKAYTTLSSITIDDANIKAYVDKVVADSKAKAGDSLDATATTLAAAKTDIIGPISIKVIDAYLDKFDNLIVNGTTDKKAIVIVNSDKATATGEMSFRASVNWRKGRPVSILAKNDEGYQGETQFYPNSEPPDEPEGLSVRSVDSNSVEFEWDENDEDDLKGYRIYYRLSGGAWQEVREIVTEEDYEIVGLASFVKGMNKTFQIYIKAVDKMNNESNQSDTIEATLP